ncbi:MAG: DUF748 domain-containing protein, partial [Pseudomonadales bacterium]|nr:DUF748 domain-containing protein [Pseudomonadales bacterium]
MKKILRFLIRSFVVYLAISFLVITPALYFGLGALYEQQTGRTVDYRMAGFNPFSISVYLYDAYDRNDDNSIFWGIEALSLNLSLQSVGGALVFDSIRLDGLQLNPVITAEGVWNFEEILAYRAKQFSPKNEPENSPASVDIIIKRLFLSSRKLSFSDYSHPANYHVELNRFDVDIREFSTSSPEGRPYHLLVRNEDGGELTIDGLVSVHDAFADVKVDLQCLNLETAWRYLEPSLAFRLRSGCLSTQGVIHVSWAEELLYRVQATRVSLKQLDLENRAESFRPGFHDSLVVEELTLSAINFDTESMLLDIAAIKLDGLAIGSSSKAGAVSLPSMFSVEPKQEAAQQPVREQIARPEPTSSQRSAFSVRLGEINASQTAVTWYFSELGTRPFDVDLDEFVVKNIHWPSDEALELHLVSQINNAAILAADGNIQPESMNLDMTLGLQRFPLAWLNPLIASYADVSVDGGELALETRFQSVAGKDSKGKVTMQGEVSAFRLSALPSLLAGSAVEDDTENPTGIAASDMAENEYFLAGWKKLQWRNV